MKRATWGVSVSPPWQRRSLSWARARCGGGAGPPPLRPPESKRVVKHVQGRARCDHWVHLIRVLEETFETNTAVGKVLVWPRGCMYYFCYCCIHLTNVTFHPPHAAGSRFEFAFENTQWRKVRLWPAEWNMTSNFESKRVKVKKNSRMEWSNFEGVAKPQLTQRVKILPKKDENMALKTTFSRMDWWNFEEGGKPQLHPPKAVVAESTALPDGAQSVAGADGVEVVDPTDPTVGEWVDQEDGGVSRPGAVIWWLLTSQ